MTAEVDERKHFPLRSLFDTVAYRRLTKPLTDELANRIDKLQASFKEAQIPVQLFRTERKGTVAVIFERINRQGVPLDTMQLLSAWTWSEDFQLQSQFRELIDELDDFGFSNGEVDENLLLRCASAVLVGDPKPEAIVDISGEDVRGRFDEVKNGIKGALDFLRSNLHIERIDNLPFQTLLAPLAVFFAVSGNREVSVNDNQRRYILRWFWSTCFGRRYSSGVIRHLTEDITSMLQLKGGQRSSLGSSTTTVSKSFFLENTFGVRNVNTKTFVLLLAQQKPLSFVSGSPVDLSRTLKEYNKMEFHHVMPQKYVSTKPASANSVNCLANFCFLSRSDNRLLGGEAPSQYRAKMPAASIDLILNRALCPSSLFDDEFETFINERAEELAANANAFLSA